MKFAHIISSDVREIYDAPVMKTGYFCWHAAFRGHIGQWQQLRLRLKQFDIIMVTLAKPEVDARTVQRLRNLVSPRTIIVGVMDYAVQLWRSGYNPHALEDAIAYCDMVFGPEPMIVRQTNGFTPPGDTCKLIQHPADLENLSKVGPGQSSIELDIGAVVHRYDGNWFSPYAALRDLPYLYGAWLMDAALLDECKAFFDIKFQIAPYPQFLGWVKARKCIVDSYHWVNSWGRLPIECAVLGTPCVGSSACHTQAALWPSLTSAPGDTCMMRGHIERVMEDEEFRKEALDYARAHVNTYGLSNRRLRLLEELQEKTRNFRGNEAIHKLYEESKSCKAELAGQ